MMRGVRANMLIGLLLTIWACLMCPEFTAIFRLPAVVLCMAIGERVANEELTLQDVVADTWGALGGELIIYLLGGRIL